MFFWNFALLRFYQIVEELNVFKQHHTSIYSLPSLNWCEEISSVISLI